MILRKVIVLIALLLLTNLAHAQDSDSFTFDDRERSYHISLPDSYASDVAVPLIIALHGAGDTGDNFRDATRLVQEANEHGHLIVFPDGYDRGWNFLNEDQMLVDDYTDDVLFLAALIDEVSADYAVDAEHIYLVGFSNGGLLALRAACDLSDQLAGIAVVGANYSFEIVQHCVGADPIDIFLTLGTEDQAFPWDGFALIGRSGILRTNFSFRQTRTFLATWYGCSSSSNPARAELPGTAVPIVRELFDDCEAGARIATYALVGFPHQWPHEPLVMLGETDFGDMLDAIWQFWFEPRFDPVIEITPEGD